MKVKVFNSQTKQLKRWNGFFFWMEKENEKAKKLN